MGEFTMVENDQFWRHLAIEGVDKVYGKDEVRIDYSVLSVGVMTLGLILIVEVLRHKLDHMVHHHAFYKHVVEGVYSELATLGIVEFCLFLMATYFEDYDKKKYKVFAAVHFLLFYTAIFNALGSALLHMGVQRISHRQWVATEALDLDHYVELREQFDRVKEQLDGLKKKRRGKKNSTVDDEDSDDNNKNRGDSESLSSSDSDADDTYAEDDFHLRHALLDFVDQIRYPSLKSKYNRLLQQVRFHELRVHFLQSYSLPLKFRVSDYLLRSVQGVLVKLIHVSPIAWLLLTGVVNLFYYILGIISYKAENTEVVGRAMTAIFFAGIFLFLVASWLLANKMKSIFKTIMHSETLWDVHQGRDQDERDRLAEEQKNLFWAGDPKLVIAAIQFMMFGYAVVISTLIIFWEEIGAGSVSLAFFVVAVATCFLLFIYETSSVIPRFTLCTSLAQLVDECRLYEALGAFHLAEAKRIESEDQTEHSKKPDSVIVDSPSVVSESPSVGSSTVASSRMNLSQGTAATALMEMVKSDTASLRVYLPDSESEGSGSRRQRIKQHSDGVSSMRHDGLPPQLLDHPPRTRRKARSDGVSFMAMAERLDLYQMPQEEDDTSIHSGHSDLNDIPFASPFQREDDDDDESTKRISFADLLYKYFMSRRHIVVSNVFGTMIAFFFVGQRVESFFHSEGIANEKFVHFDFAHEYIFWLLILWILCFITKFFFVMYAFSPGPRVIMKEQTVIVATYLDLLLCLFCLAMLLIAESKRCCFPGLDVKVARSLAEYDSARAPCSCPRFGTRQYGGLGWIEPWVSLLALRVFRHYVAKRLLEFYHRRRGTTNMELLPSQSIRLNPFDVFHSERPTAIGTDHGRPHQPIGHHNHHDHGAHHEDHGEHQEHGTAVELWERALGKYPELVARHGEFSCEVLRAMLGLSTEESDEHSASVSNSQSDRSVLRITKPTDAPVKKKAPKQTTHPLRKANPLHRSVVVKSIFSSPKARLLRSMRRCDRKYLPILDEWTVVDVVMTRYELVYFAAEDVDDGGLDKAGLEALESLQKTRGGKGLRLEHVAKGRRVVGHVQLSDVTTVHVERSQKQRGEAEFTNVEVRKTEFWKAHFSSNASTLKRGERWTAVTEDLLRLNTRQSQTLYLRFYSDLEEEEQIRDTGSHAEEDETLGKDNALHWAQTLGRVRGSDLDQELPHFATGTDDELMDYLVIPPLQRTRFSIDKERVEI